MRSTLAAILLFLAAAIPAAHAQRPRITVAAGQTGHSIPSALWGVSLEDFNLSADDAVLPELERNRSLEDKTWKNHGLRPDIAKALEALKPGFMRFSVGSGVERANTTAFDASQEPGCYECLALAADLGAEPLCYVDAGMSFKENTPVNEVGSWVKDAFAALEFANGGTNTLWGGHRAAAGHPEPFKLKYVEMGDANGGPAYAERWSLLVKAVCEKYPEVKLIADHWTGNLPALPRPDFVDEHYFDTPEGLMRHATQYDTYDRAGPKVLVGEYAARNCGLGNLRGALGEAAYMTGLERNSDVVSMASHARLLANVNHRSGSPALINFDSSRWYGLPSYYVQMMFAENRGDTSLPTVVECPLAQRQALHGMIGVGAWNTAAEFKNIKVTTPDGKILFADDFTHGTNGWKFLGGGDWEVANGVLRQTAEKEFVRALAGDRNWTDYTLTLQARKISGAEGFLILFRIGGDEDRLWWNLGGWKNTADAIEAGGLLGSKPGFVETGRWYDLQVVVTGNHVQCYRDGQLEHDVDYDPAGDVASLYAVSARDRRTGDLIIKVVNVNPSPLETDLELAGATGLTGRGKAVVLTSQDSMDENSLDNPAKVSPRTAPVTFTGTSLRHSFPGNSFTVLRLKGNL